jgi:Sec-independent protein secretion pathway component TatC
MLLALVRMRIWIGLFAALIFVVAAVVAAGSTAIDAGLIPLVLLFFFGMALLAIVLAARDEKA